ncbi:S-adenosyl-L-methionine-dependent methyltransferase [Halenospora varia]|nr:S-adenosyl-L-methionine-dependent methyltransferase [Halenospora varia]
MMASRILDLANIISKNTTIIYELAKAQDAVLDATSELNDLLMPPISALHINGNAQNLISLNAICRFNLANSFAPRDEASFSQMAEYSGLGEAVTKSLLHHAMTLRIFCEPRKGIVAHTARSVLFREQGYQELRWDWVNEILELKESEEPAQTGFALANNTNKPIYKILGDDPTRTKRFADTMGIFTAGKGYEASHVTGGFDWQSLGNSTVVDIGGFRGHIGIDLATQFQSLKIIVQDFESVIKGAEKEVPDVVAERAHDIFSDQTVVADVYYYGWVFHNWSNKYCIKILRSLVPALRPSARIIINDVCIPEPGTTVLWREKELR